ncbi:IS110 family transposase [Clostridia bacterium]|nr:IS110 family transposase [Clostridia bacterium]QRN86753.1 IS110 family transposase [Clostridia bacterium]QRN86780.1 IS110 family transposase [Clostridia bacterium]
MIYVGIDVAKNKHDCFIVDSEGEIIHNVFTFKNSRQGFNLLLQTIPDVSHSQILIGLEATGHYSNNLINFLTENNLPVIILNPLQTSLFRKAQTLRKTKTDSVDAKTITMMLRTGDFKSHSPVSYHHRELKSLSRHRSRLVKTRASYKMSITRLLDIVFPELPALVWSIHQASVYQLLLAFPNTREIADAHLTKLTHVLSKASHGRYGKEEAVAIRDSARTSIGTCSPSLSYELKQTIHLIQNLQNEIKELDQIIEQLVGELNSPLLSIPGISHRLAAVILSEIGDITRFESPAKLLAFAGLDPSTHQSGKFTATQTRMVKRGSPYLRWALLQAARLIVMRDATFKEYYKKKRSEGKHHYVALSHTTKKLIRVIFKLLSSNQNYVEQ